MAQLQGELERMNAENQKLRGMLSQVTNNYSTLQMHLVTLMQQQQSRGTETLKEHQVIMVCILSFFMIELVVVVLSSYCIAAVCSDCWSWKI